MLEIKNATFGFNKYKLFENLNFSVNYGEIVKISGKNGCGKTTLLNCINGFLNLHSGEIILDDKKINNLQPFKISRLGIKRYMNNREFYSMKIEDILRLVYNKNEAKEIVPWNNVK
jgi:ABC-type cobalamin/Fe3+-siderophores transport system ATPase subunit